MGLSVTLRNFPSRAPQRNGIQEVTSSILVRSTNYVNYAASLLRGRPPFAPFTFAAAALTFDLRCPPR